jgi:aspartyl-tRNA(Asn)/glutamyl-tRNA(Gln) amidotransferase subunit C
MSLTIEEVEKIAHLARLELSAAEKQRFQHQLSEILNYAARLQAVDTSSIPALADILPGPRGLRPDESRPGMPVENLLGGAPQVSAGQFRVPPVLE